MNENHDECEAFEAVMPECPDPEGCPLAPCSEDRLRETLGCLEWEEGLDVDQLCRDYLAGSRDPGAYLHTYVDDQAPEGVESDDPEWHTTVGWLTELAKIEASGTDVRSVLNKYLADSQQYDQDRIDSMTAAAPLLIKLGNFLAANPSPAALTGDLREEVLSQWGDLLDEMHRVGEGF